MATNPKTVGMIAGGAGGGMLSALSLANDVSIVVMQGAVGCVVSSTICDAGGRLVAAGALIVFTLAGAALGRVATPAKSTSVSEAKGVPHDA